MAVVVLLVLGVAFIAYGVSIMLAWSGSSFFLVWYALGAVCLAVAWAVRSGAWATAPQFLRAGVIALALLLVAGVVTGSALVVGTAVAEVPDGLDCIVVLGAQVHEDRRPGNALQFRLDEACSYLLRNPQTRCVVCGGQGPNEPCTEADAMAEYLVAHGIAEERILREDRSTDTAQNVRFAAELLRAEGKDPAELAVAICTNDFHVYRSVLLAKKQGFAQAVGMAAPSLPWYFPNNVFRECLALAKDGLQGNL